MVLDCRDAGLPVFKWGQSGKPELLVTLALVLPQRNWTEFWELSNLPQAPLSLASSLGFLSQLLPAQKLTQVWEEVLSA